jgi:hypothetical protein
LVIPNDAGRRPKSVAIQLSPDNRYDQEYLEHYLAQESDFEVYWCDIEPFMEELWTKWAREPEAAEAEADDDKAHEEAKGSLNKPGFAE